MPTALRSGPYRFFFYSADGIEPPHIHVARDDAIAKFWLQPVRLKESSGFRPHETRQIQGIITDHLDVILTAWHEHFRR
jgi:hypothetical protein